jgi:glutamine---fructose-6-phosphate transaminase (isomerizing)
MLMKEAAHFHSEGMSCAALRHGPFEMLSANCFAVVFAGDPHVESLNRALVEDIRQTGAKTGLVSADSESEPLRLPVLWKEARPIFEMLPLQMISLALARIAGREAGKFDRIGKVTTTE